RKWPSSSPFLSFSSIPLAMRGRLLFFILSFLCSSNLSFESIKLINYKDCIGAEKKCVIYSPCIRDASADKLSLVTLNQRFPERIITDIACDGFTVRRLSEIAFEIEMQGRGSLYLTMAPSYKFGCDFSASDIPDPDNPTGPPTFQIGNFSSTLLGVADIYQINERVPGAPPETEEKNFNYCRFSLQTWGEDLMYDLWSNGPKFRTGNFPEGINITTNRTYKTWKSKRNTEIPFVPFWEQLFTPISLIFCLSTLFLSWVVGSKLVISLRKNLSQRQRKKEKLTTTESKDIGTSAEVFNNLPEMTAIDPETETPMETTPPVNVEVARTGTESKVEESKKVSNAAAVGIEPSLKKKVAFENK
ncbi:hypothetical protein PFISCL1PPCAC_24722, partial [Pristionchus fissidentatus]